MLLLSVVLVLVLADFLLEGYKPEDERVEIALREDLFKNPNLYLSKFKKEHGKLRMLRRRAQSGF